ncbi:MAG: hypothetical protein RIR65_1520 [Planctomycetota bacterium]|jgi:hypothetical protein
MQHRLGRCDACRASYEIPASYLPRFARCRLCRGMVRIGRAGGEEPWRPMPRRPAAAVLPAPTEEGAREATPARFAPALEREYLLPRVAAATLAPLTGELAFDEPSAATAWASADALDGALPARASGDEAFDSSGAIRQDERRVALDFGAGLG